MSMEAQAHSLSQLGKYSTPLLLLLLNLTIKPCQGHCTQSSIVIFGRHRLPHLTAYDDVET
jgi:hypothetical protein